MTPSRLPVSGLLLSSVIGALLVLVVGCGPGAPPPEKRFLHPTRLAELPGWSEDSVADAMPALLRSCRRPWTKSAPELPIANARTVGRIDLGPVCRAAAGVADDAESIRRFFEAWFEPYLGTDSGNANGLFTGYYEAELRGSETASGRYRTPIYQRPADLPAPLPSRAEIEAGALAGLGLELLWVDNAVDAFFLHIQGSGRVLMDDGRIVRIGFAGRNGHDYVAIGRELIRRGAIPKENMSMQAIRAWLNDNPDQAADIMALNPSFIFFRKIDGDGPIGAQGVALTPERSLAVDTAFIPLGIPLWLDTTQPLSPDLPLRRLVVAQDTGSAIKGPVRGDLFWGYGDVAAEKAGAMKQTGRYYLLVPRHNPGS